MKKKRAGRPLQWHPAFYAGVQIELAEDAENLIFENEHHLGTKPKMIDILIVKKNGDVPVRKNIGRIFRKYNIIEYKCPTDSQAIDDFYRVYGYTCFYKADTGTNDSVPVEDLTITFVCSKYPGKLIKHWQKNRRYDICQVEPGIYYIKGDIIPMQLLILPRLSRGENLWLSGLGSKVTESSTIERLTREYGKHRNEMLYQSVMDIIVKVNAERFQEVKDGMCEALMELMKDEIQNEVDKAKAQLTEKVTEEVTAAVTARCEEKGMKALIDVLKRMALDSDSAYQEIINTEAYANVTKEQMMRYW